MGHRMLSVASSVLAEHVLKLRVVQKRPYLWIIGASEVVARLPGLSCLQKNFEVLLRTTRDLGIAQRLGEERASTTRRCADKVR